MEEERSSAVLCSGCAEGFCLTHCEICGANKSIWGCDYSFPREGRGQSHLSFEERGLPEWRCERPGNSQAIGGAIKVALIVIAVVVLDFFTGGWLQAGLSALWSLVLGW